MTYADLDMMSRFSLLGYEVHDRRHGDGNGARKGVEIAPDS